LSILKQSNKGGKKQKNKKIDRELPYFLTIVTLLATSGFGPYTIFQKMKDFNLLPSIKLESEKILKRIDLLGMDPLTVMRQTKDRCSSRDLGEFFNGYVSAIQGGGDVVNYLKTKMDGAFDRYSDIEKESVEKVKALVETYMTMQIVVLAVYIIATVVSSPSNNSSSSNFDIQYAVIFFPPLISILFILAAYKFSQIKIKELEIKKIASFAIPSIAAGIALISLNVFPEYNAFILAGSLIAASIWPAMKFTKIYSSGMDAESAAPQILRDVAEARKAGLGPEKCVIRACKRTDYKSFNSVANSIANKLEWGISLKKIYELLEKEVKNFQVLINFRILFEIISAGGGNVDTLDSLAGISEKIQNIEKSKRELIQPYIMIGFMLIGMTSFVTLLVIDSLTTTSLLSEIDEEKIAEIEEQSQSSFELLGMAILVQAWLSGLFLGKITTGTYSGGFKYSIFLVMIALGSIIIITMGFFDISSIFG